jgi:hypothetical protein
VALCFFIITSALVNKKTTINLINCNVYYKKTLYSVFFQHKPRVNSIKHSIPLATFVSRVWNTLLKIRCSLFVEHQPVSRVSENCLLWIQLDSIVWLVTDIYSFGLSRGSFYIIPDYRGNLISIFIFDSWKDLLLD